MTVLKEGAAMAELGTLMAWMTVVFTVTMVGWIVWTWLPSRREELEAASRMPFDEED